MIRIIIERVIFPTCHEFGCLLHDGLIDLGLACLLASALCLPASALTDPWSVDIRQHTAVDRTYKQGESREMQITLRDGTLPLDLTGATARFYWYTNATDNLWWTNAATVKTPRAGIFTATWTPAMDVGAAAYPYWVGLWLPGSTCPVWRVNGTIRLLSSPGFVPNALVPPVRTLDFSAITITNAPWVQASDWQTGSNALAEAFQLGLTNLSDRIDSNAAAIALLPPPSADALRLVNSTNSPSQWIDSAGDMWAVTPETNSWHLVIPERSVDLWFDQLGVPLPNDGTNEVEGYNYFVTNGWELVIWPESYYDPPAAPVAIWAYASAETNEFDQQAWGAYQVDRASTNITLNPVNGATENGILSFDFRPASTGVVRKLASINDVASATNGLLKTEAADARYPQLANMPSNTVGGWLVYDYGSNDWLQVICSNRLFTVWEVAQ